MLPPAYVHVYGPWLHHGQVALLTSLFLLAGVGGKIRHFIAVPAFAAHAWVYFLRLINLGVMSLLPAYTSHVIRDFKPCHCGRGITLRFKLFSMRKWT